ncbi:hypothetical protein ACHHYP_20546 [Achlya hypogyna]|uniref:Uncharacterized protein n=1 Tax=Achlya hypogyna TaxID=1202772 RepID=A0A1V9YJ65_ACHHY|nr:hypothetical protein ACHHYP_20546 [Achlya hypogyna]
MKTSSTAFYTPPKAHMQHMSVAGAIDAAGRHRHWKSVFTCTDGVAPNRRERRTVTRRPHTRGTADGCRFCLGDQVDAREELTRLDGFSAEFYKLNPDLLCCMMRIVFEAQLARGQMLRRHRESAVILLYKNGDREVPGNYRPITLMSVELKPIAWLPFSRPPPTR